MNDRDSTRVSYRGCVATMFTVLGVWGLLQGESFQGEFYLVLAVGWLLMGIFRPRYASKEAVWLKSQRSRVEGLRDVVSA